VSDDPEPQAVECLGHRFGDPRLLRAALTHPSWAVEHGGEDNERLEFLGDSVISFVIAAHLYDTFHDLDEGTLTRMKVSLTEGRTLAGVGRQACLHDVLRLGRGAAREADRDSVLENAFEAVIGAVYLDAGLETARDVVLRALADRVDRDALLATDVDAKSRLQELTQSRGAGLPVYEIVDRTGPAHEPRFTAVVHIGGVVSGTGSGVSKQAAEQAAAEAALNGM
jgi:ribonuclease-3